MWFGLSLASHVRQRRRLSEEGCCNVSILEREDYQTADGLGMSRQG